jgi:hypothetical protein
MTESSDVLKNHTNFVRANGGLDIYRLQLSDELCRNISSYSSTKPPPNDNVNTWFKNDELGYIDNPLLISCGRSGVHFSPSQHVQGVPDPCRLTYFKLPLQIFCLISKWGLKMVGSKYLSHILDLRIFQSWHRTGNYLLAWTYTGPSLVNHYVCKQNKIINTELYSKTDYSSL